MRLLIHDERGAELARHEGVEAIAGALAPLGLEVGRIAVGEGAGAGLPQPDEAALAELRQRYGFVSADRVTLKPGDPQGAELRARFRREHTHDDHELRIFVGGRGLFEVAVPDGARAQLLCEAGEWVAVPAGTRHAFDAGAGHDFDALRLFSRPEGWLATWTDSADTPPHPDLEVFVAAWGAA
jgi:1,2-dihydroxy-3-keto-5-methylthiopentene dioxygenase